MTDVLKKVPRRHWVFSIPKRLRIYFMYDRSLLGKPNKCAWNVASAFLKSAVPRDGAVPGASIAIRTYGDFLNFNPHFQSIGNLCPFPFRFDDHPSAGGRGTIEKPVVFSLTKSEFLSKNGTASIDRKTGYFKFEAVPL